MNLQHSKRVLLAAMFAAAIGSASLFTSSANAAAISYGNFVAGGTTFTNVSESSGTDPVPLYGAPTSVFNTGLLFTPAGFVATATGGAQDITDGQLDFGVTSATGISSVALSEGGDFTLVGTGTPLTSADAGAIIRVTVTQVNGVNVVPFAVPTANSSVAFNLVANPGLVQPWSLSVSDAISLPAGQVATGVQVVINNQLLALSEASSTSFIAKKAFDVSIGGTGPSTPEPMSASILFVGMIGMAARRRRH